MNFVMTLGVVLAGFWFDAAAAQEGYFGHDHDKWHHGFYQTLERPDTKRLWRFSRGGSPPFLCHLPGR